MRDFEFVPSLVHRTFVFPDGRMCDVMSCRYDCKVDLSCMKYISSFDSENYSSSSLPTMQELVDSGVVLEKSCISVECEVSFYDEDERPSPFSFVTEELFAMYVVSCFKDEFGVVVSVSSVLHNFRAWKNDCKSGYRDGVRGYHLFSPCGCNPLSFRYSSLHPLCSDWQQTYVC